MGELLIVSRQPSEKYPEGRHYVVNMWDSELHGTRLTMHAIIMAHGNSYEEAQTIVENLK